eukprot:357324-Pyramimonas_sp.AAC.1
MRDLISAVAMCMHSFISSSARRGSVERSIWARASSTSRANSGCAVTQERILAWDRSPGKKPTKTGT